MRILIVDDDPVTRLALGRILREAASEVVEAQDGEQAWTLLVQGLRPLVCLSDVAMPHLDGIGLVRRAAADPVLDDLPFILVSSAAEQGTLAAAVDAGAQGYVLKPFLATHTLAAVAAAARHVKEARAEHFLVTRRRLGLTLEALARQLTALRDAVQAAGPGPAPDLAAQARELGLWRCAALLEAPHAPQHAARVRAEAACLVDDQLRAMVQLAPTT